MGAALAFFGTKLGQAVVLITVAVMACGGSYAYGRLDQSRLDNVAAVKAQLAAAKGDLNIANALAGIAEDEKRAIETASAANQEKIDDYEKALAERPDDKCRLNSDDVRRLRSLSTSP